MSTTLPAKRNLARIYLLEAKTEVLKAWRLPVYSVFTLAFPLMFYLIFGLTFGGQSAGAVDVAAYMLATYGAFGVIGASLFGFGVGLASERGQGWMRLKRASPMPPAAYFSAKIVMALLFSLLVVLGLFLLGYFLFGVRLPLQTWGALLGTLLLGALPFCAFGMMLGYLAGPNSAAAVVNLVYLPMAFVSGLWIPLEQLPAFIQNLSPYLPAYHYAQLALGTLGVSAGQPAWLHIAALLGFTALFLTVALIAYRRDEGKTYG
jgi:ABC-2 type transport system permease protein